MRFRRPEGFRRALPILIVAISLTAAGASSTAEGDSLRGVYVLDDETLVPTRPVLSEDVFDPIFAFVLGVLEQDHYGGVTTAWFDSLATAEGGSKMPYDAIATMERRPGDDTVDAFVRIRMGERTEFPIPYSILGYNPGSIRFSETVDMLHWRVGDRDFEFVLDEEDGETVTVNARDAHLFIMSEGTMDFDIDGWLDRMMGGRLDDVSMRGFFVFRDGQDYVGLGFGYNNSDDGRTGAFDFVRNESIFPASKAYLSVGRTMRALAEERLAAWRRTRGEDAVGTGASGDARLDD